MLVAGASVGFSFSVDIVRSWAKIRALPPFGPLLGYAFLLIGYRPFCGENMATAPELPPLPLRAELPPGEHSRIADAPIEDVYKEKLKILGYLTVEQVLSVAETASLRSRLNEYLGADVSVVLAEVPVQDFAPQLSLEAYTADYTFGARLREEAVTAVIPTTDLSAARHVPRFRAASLGLTPPGGPLGTGFGGPGGPIRDQAYRGLPHRRSRNSRTNLARRVTSLFLWPRSTIAGQPPQLVVRAM
jgi:hypothetical protein